MKPLHYEAIYRMLLERFGAPIVGDRQGVPTSGEKKDMGNRGFGADLSEDACCDQCGMMQTDMDQAHACEADGPMATELDEDDLVQKAPPGGEKVVKALKKQKGVKNPWAVAWAMKKRGEI